MSLPLEIRATPGGRRGPGQLGPDGDSVLPAHVLSAPPRGPDNTAPAPARPGRAAGCPPFADTAPALGYRRDPPRGQPTLWWPATAPPAPYRAQAHAGCAREYQRR